jgi:cation diffusion facilitator family transporter
VSTLQSGLRASALGIAVNSLLATIKVVAGVLGNSYALIADGIESTADIISSFIVWSGLRIAAIPADDDHPYGHGKAESMAALVVALALLGAAIAIAIQSIREIRTPHHAPHPLTLVVLVGVVIIKEALFRRVLKTSDALDSTALKADAWHHRSDAITSATAFIGIVIALIGGPGYESADDYAALGACLIISWNGLSLLRPAIDEMMDASPKPTLVQQIRHTAESVPDVHGIGRCRVRKSGTELFVDIHIKIPGEWTVHHGHQLAHNVEDTLRSNFPRIRFVSVHVEPSTLSPNTLQN